jgi:anti-sigma-K factor RskA
MTEERHAELKALIAPYVLGAVPLEEAEEIRAHLLSCEECMREADEYSATSGDLALAVEPKALPDGFADNVIALVREETVPAPTRVTPRRRRWFSIPAIGFAALLIVVAVLAGVLVAVTGDLREERRITAALLRADAIRLDGGGAAAAVVQERGGALFVARDLPQAPGDDIYQLWFLGGEQPVSAGTFEASEGRVVLRTGLSLEGVSGAAITVEPPGGSEQPTTEPVLRSA